MDQALYIGGVAVNKIWWSVSPEDLQGDRMKIKEKESDLENPWDLSSLWDRKEREMIQG